MSNPKAAVCSVGCKVSKYESEAMAHYLRIDGYEIVDFSHIADVYIINTCTVTNVGDKKSRQVIRRARQINSDAIVVVSGCYSQVSPEEVMKIDGVDIILGSQNHSDIAEIIETYKKENRPFNAKKINVDDISLAKSFENVEAKDHSDRIRAYIKIEDGCDNFCSYCIIPFARGHVRSRTPSDAINEIKAVCKASVKEIVLTGIHVGSYGKDLRDTQLLENLIIDIGKIDELKRLRLSSLEPQTITGSFLDALAKTDKFCDYFHLSLQSGCDKTLTRMNRKYTAREYADAVRLIRSIFQRSAIWTDVIVGFPGETCEDFEESRSFIENSGIVKLHIFPFSPKKGTKACEMAGQVNSKTKAERAKIMQELDDKLYNGFLNKNIGGEACVLFERRGKDGYFSGHTKNNILVKVKSQRDLTNEIVHVRLCSIIEKSNILGEIIN